MQQLERGAEQGSRKVIQVSGGNGMSPVEPQWRQTATPPPTNGADGEYIGIEQVLAVLWRQKIAVGASLLTGICLALLLYSSQPKFYKAKTTLEIQLPNGDYLDHRQLNPNMEVAPQTMEPYLQTQIRLMQSDSALQQVAERLTLSQHPEYMAQPSRWKKLLGMKTAGSEIKAVDNEFIDGVREHVDVRMLGETQIIEIAFEAQDPALAAAGANALATAYLAFSVNRQVDAINQTGDLLGSQIADARESLKASETKLQDYVSTSGLLSGGDKDSVAEQRLRQVQGILAAAQDARITDEAHYQAAMDPEGKPANDVVESETLRVYRLRMTDLRQQLAQSSEVLQPTHYKVREIQAQLAEVEQAYKRERTGTIDRLKNQMESAKAREGALLKDYNEQVGRASAQMTNSVRYSSLKNDVETQQKLYDSLVQRTKEASVLSAMRSSNAKVVDRAAVPYNPIRPVKALYASLGFGAGLLPGLLIAFYRDRKQSRRPVRRDDYPLGLRSLGVLPHFEPSTLTEEPETACWTSPESPLARVIEGACNYLFPRGAWPRVIGVTSPHNGEGKTTAACNLAIELARSGKSVLLVDADHHTPRLHDVFAITNHSGFSEFMAPGGAKSGLVSAWVTRIPNLAVLPCGERRMSPADHYADVVAGLRSEFDAVIIDLPAVLASDTAWQIAANVDTVALVVSSEYTTPQGAELAIRKLVAQRIPLAGALFNQVNKAGAPRLIGELAHAYAGTEHP